MNTCAKMAIGFLLFLLSTLAVVAQQRSTLTTEKVVNNLYVVKGGVANTGFLISDNEVLAIDAQMTADSARQMLAEIKKLTSKPVTKLVLTHSDGDHVNGIGGFPQGLEIIAHVQTREDMAQAFASPSRQALQAYLPTKTFTERLDLQVGSNRIQLLYFGPAHTSGDIVVFFPAEKVVFVGDLVSLERTTPIHLQKGGSAAGLAKALKELAELDADQFVPGHGRIASKEEIETLAKNAAEK